VQFGIISAVLLRSAVRRPISSWGACRAHD